MKTKRITALAALALALTACGAKPSQETVSSAPLPAASQGPAVSQEPQKPTMADGTWKLIEADYQAPTQASRLDGIEIPDYNGMDESAFYDRAYELGFNSDTGPYPVWAEGMMLSNIGR